jgi:HEAT repeat protein
MSKLLVRTLVVAGTVLGVLGLGRLEAGKRLKKDDVPKTIKLLESGNARVRAQAAEDLGDLGKINSLYVKDAVAPLLEMVKNDKDTGARKAAATAVGLIARDADKAVPVLVEALQDKSMEIKFAVIASLGRFGPEAREAVPALREIVKNKDKANKKLFQAAAVALKQISGKQKN